MKKGKKRLPLKGKQKEVWGFILSFYEDYGVSPTLVEIAERMSFFDKDGKPMHQASAHHVEALEKKGYVKRTRGTWRNISIIEQK